MKMYFNNNNGERYEILARVYNEVMLLRSMNGHYIVARCVKNNEWGAGHYWMDNCSGAWKDFFKIAYKASGVNMSYKQFKKMFREV